MKKNITLGLMLLSGAMTLSAQSPYTGAEPTTGEEYYFYNVETGKWIQNYTAIPGATRDRYNTAANVGEYGRPMKMEANGNGTWRINTLSGDEILGKDYGDGGLLYLDWNGNGAEWTLEGDAANGYVITYEDKTLGVSDEGLLANDVAEGNNHWQLVTAAERLEKMANASSEAPQDVTWLLINPELMNNDHRSPQWTINRNGGGENWNQDFRPNRIFETWNYSSVDFYQTVSVPNGKYEVTAYALFSPTEGNGTCYADYEKYVAEGDATVNGYLYANDASVKLPSIYSFTSETPVPNYAAKDLGNGVSIIDGFWQASRAMAEDGKFKTEAVNVTVTDGQLRVGIKETNNSDPYVSHWMIIGSFQLKYLGNDVDITEYINNLSSAIAEAENFKGNTTDVLADALATALASAKEALSSTDTEELAAQTLAVKAALEAAKSLDDTILEQIVVLAKEDGVEDTSTAEGFIANGTSVDEMNRIINDLRVARKVANIETDNATYEGNEVQEGDFYLYNVGRKAYLTSGSDWGAHAALGYPGLLSTLAANGEGYTIQFNELIQGEARDKYLSGSPYCDAANGDKGTYTFEAVDGKPGVYNIKGDRGYLAFDPNGEVDGGGILHYNTVTAMWSEPKNEDAEWMLITKEDRLAQMDNASKENPVDVTVIIRDASFNKYAALDNPWSDQLNQSWEWGNRDFGDKNTETYDSQEYELYQEITVPRAGIYEVSVQAYYRDGSIEAHVESVANDAELVAAPVLYADSDEQPLVYIHEEADKAPGEGANTAIGNIPDNMIDASKFFQNGLYWNTVRTKATADDLQMIIGIEKVSGNRPANWIVADNFRIKYLGVDPGSAIDGVVVEPEQEGPTVIYNLQGIRVAEPQQSGLYIVNGKKVFIKK